MPFDTNLSPPILQADRKTSLDGLDPTSRYRSPSHDNPQYHYDSLNQALGAQPASAPRTQRRPVQPSSNSKTSQSASSCIDGDKDGRKRLRTVRKTLQKPFRRDSHHSDTSSGPQSGHADKEESSNFRPKLGQIREGKISRTSSSQGSSVISSASEPRTRRRRHSEDRSRVRQRHSSSQKHSESLAKLSNPSLTSLLSDSTMQSTASGESSTTVTQRSDQEPSVVDGSNYQRSRRARPSKTMAASNMEPSTPDVFQFMSQSPHNENFVIEEVHGASPSTIAPSSSASASGSEEEDMLSSNAGSSQTRGTPMTSPASVQAPKPLYASSFVHGHDDDEPAEESDMSEEQSDMDEEEEEEEDSEGDDDHEGSDVVHEGPPHHQSLEKVQLPRAPSPTSRRSDPHIRRLRQQERDLANHVLQSPQPHKDFQFAGGPSPLPVSTMPLYSPHAYSAATPANYEATAGYPPEWPPFPPPLPIGYPGQSTLESPGAGHALPLTVQPPVSVPGMPGQHAALHPYPAQPPPHYQPKVPTSDVSRATVAGYELLANKLSEPVKGSKSPRRNGNIVPMYRKFEHLNHRVLLHLQDEVCELEEELRDLDECIVQMSPRDESGHAYPASRRGDAEYGSELHYKRTELLGRIFQKLGQYSKYRAT